MSDSQPFYAYPDQTAGLEAIMRISAVKRWHMIATTKVQTLAEHSCNVALLVHYIAHTAPMMYFGPSCELVLPALTHDIAEVFIGDMPSHTKRYIKQEDPDLGLAIEGLEDFVTPATAFNKQTGSAKLLTKLCDIADGIRFIRLYGVDATAVHAQTGLEAQLIECRDKMNRMYLWPDNVKEHVMKTIMFYAYEYS